MAGACIISIEANTQWYSWGPVRRYSTRTEGRGISSISKHKIWRLPKARRFALIWSAICLRCEAHNSARIHIAVDICLVHWSSTIIADCVFGEEFAPGTNIHTHTHMNLKVSETLATWNPLHITIAAKDLQLCCWCWLCAMQKSLPNGGYFMRRPCFRIAI